MKPEQMMNEIKKREKREQTCTSGGTNEISPRMMLRLMVFKVAGVVEPEAVAAPDTKTSLSGTLVNKVHPRDNLYSIRLA